MITLLLMLESFFISFPNNYPEYCYLVYWDTRESIVILPSISHNMSDNTHLLPNTSHNNERPRVPGNIYYTIPYFEPFFFSYVFIASFTLAWIADYLPTEGKICLWAGFAATCALLIAIHPSICTERMRSDEAGRPVRVRRPLIGFKRWEVALDVDGIDRGLYDAADGNTDVRLHDRCRYGYAWIRV